MRTLGCLLLCFGLPNLADAEGRAHHDNPPAASDPTGAFEWVPPSDWPAAKQINAYLGAYLQNCILAPLDAPVAPPRTALQTMSIDFAAHLAAAQTPAERALYTSASNACDLLARVLDERDQEQINLVTVNASSNAVNPLDRPAYAVSGHYGWNLEWERARAQRRQEAQARLATIDRNNSFVTFGLKHWADQTGPFRQAIQAAAINVNAAQIRFDREMAGAAAQAASPTSGPAPNAAVASQAMPPPVPPPNAPATMPPSPNAAPNPAPAAPGAAVDTASADPATGDWWTQRGGSITLGDDHIIRNGRDGTWVYTGTGDKGRKYELRWNHKGWVDYVVLSADGKMLYGANMKEAIWYTRH